ncbi:MAG: conserved hypothetical protein [Methanobrevibacter sp. CfCl-M3]
MDKGKISEKPYNPKQHVEYKDGKKITKNNPNGSESSPYTKFNELKRKQEVERLKKLYGKDRTMAYGLNFVFPGIGLFYLGKESLSIILMPITLILYWIILYITSINLGLGIIWLMIVVFTYNIYSSVFLVTNVFEPNNFLTDEDVLNYAPNSKKAFKIRYSTYTTDKNIKNTKINTEKDVEEVYNGFKNYKEDINNLKAKYQSKEEVAKKIIKEHFPPPQLTYDRFMGEIDMWSEIFHRQAESTLNIINITEECTAKVDEELKNRLEILKSVVEKMDELVVELTINLGNSNRETTAGEVKELLTDMQNVIDSVKEYN